MFLLLLLHYGNPFQPRSTPPEAAFLPFARSPISESHITNRLQMLPGCLGDGARSSSASDQAADHTI